MAPTGQALVQTPHPLQSSVSISALSVTEIAAKGQAVIHCPQAVQILSSTTATGRVKRTGCSLLGLRGKSAGLTELP
jgi:hypothetical protein